MKHHWYQLTTACLLAGAITAASAERSKPTTFIEFNPSIIYGQELGDDTTAADPLAEDNNFINVTFLHGKMRWGAFQLEASASVGFTERENSSATNFNHYTNSGTVNTTWFFTEEWGAFLEATFANKIDGAENAAQYFAPNNIQSGGLIWERRTILDVLYRAVDRGYIFEPNSRYTQTSSLRIGKTENENYFGEIVWADVFYRMNNNFSVSGNLSTGFTSPRNDKTDVSYYYSKATGRLSYRPNNSSVGIFIEGSYAKDRDSIASNEYFRQAPYAGIGIEIDGFKIIGNGPTGKGCNCSADGKGGEPSIM